MFLHYCGFHIVAARVFGRWKVFWLMQNWYTNDARNSSICLECCNGINPYSRLTGTTATLLCGCGLGGGPRGDLRVLPRPVIFDMRHDVMELHPITDDSGWPADGNGSSYTAVLALANATKARMEAAVHPTPTAAGAGQCTEGVPETKLQPCCPGCKEPFLPMQPCRGGSHPQEEDPLYSHRRNSTTTSDERLAEVAAAAAGCACRLP